MHMHMHMHTLLPRARARADPDVRGGRMESDDPFDVFDEPPVPSRTDDPFDIFDAPPAEEGGAAAKRARPSPIQPLVRHFIARHAPTAVRDLRAAGDIGLASNLEAAAGHMAAEPPALEACRIAAELAAAAAWTTVSGAGEGTKSLSREAYVLAQALLCGVRAALDGDAAGALSSLDRAFILGGQTELFRDCVELLDDGSPGGVEAPAATSPPRPPPPPPPSAVPSDGCAPVERMPLPSSAEAFRALHARARPVVLTGVTDGWPAMQKWADLSWLRRQHGGRLVPVELGSLNGGEETTWGERIMPLSDFIDRHLASDANEHVPIGYLAQHPLFEQIPRLKRDFDVPHVCAASGGGVRHVNAWLGPAGTVTPLHFDSYDNILTQAVGYKRVRLYEASQTRWLYPKAAGGGGVDAQGNVSAVDVEAPDHGRFPDFAHATALEALIGPGDGLFIPAGCWHHVRSLSTAFSVSFWF